MNGHMRELTRVGLDALPHVVTLVDTYVDTGAKWAEMRAARHGMLHLLSVGRITSPCWR